MNKSEQRKIMLNKMKNISEIDKSYCSNLAVSRLKETELYKNSSNIFVFVSFNDEISTHNFIKDSLLSGKNIYIPYTDLRNKKMYVSKLLNFGELTVGSYGILSQNENNLKIVSPEILDLTITPGVVFSENLQRIGYGGGYYDNFFSEYNIKNKVGLCYDLQVVKYLEPEIHDVVLDMIITEKKIYEVKYE